VNTRELRSALKGLDQLHSKLMLQALFRPLQNEAHCMELLTSYPEEGGDRITPEEFESKGPFYRFVRSHAAMAAICIVSWWLREAIRRSDSWIHEVDGNGRLGRLKGLKRVDQVLELAGADLARYERLDREDAVRIQETTEVTEALQLPGGRKWVQLRTHEAFAREGARMRNCLGVGAYYRNHVNEYAQYYSLRDHRGQPRVTVEVRQGLLTQALAVANTNPWGSWRTEIEALMGHLNLRLVPSRMSLGLARRRISTPLTFNSVNGHLDLHTGPEPTPLAQLLLIAGNLVARERDWLTDLPDTLWVERDCLVEHCRNLMGAPRVLIVHGRASFAGSRRLRADFERILVAGDLNLSGCASLSALPEKMHVGGRLVITGAGLRLLPASLSVGESIICDEFSTKSVADMNAYLKLGSGGSSPTRH
jgi:hypothetical protein